MDRNIKQNEAQYDLDRKLAKISALPSKDLPKYEYINDEDLGYKPSIVEQPRFDYSPLSKFLDKGWKEEEKKEGPLKAIEDQRKNNWMQSKTSTQTQIIKNNQLF